MPALGEDLKRIYRQTIYRATPPLLIQRRLEEEEIAALLPEPCSVIAVGKAASGLLKGAAAVMSIDRAFAALPEEYRQDEFPPYAEVVYGSHPEISRASFEAADALVRFVTDGNTPILFMISGGASACLARPLEPWFGRNDLIHANHALLRSGLPIESINIVRKHLSAIKGGRLGKKLPPGSMTLVLSDVSRGQWRNVGSGPTVEDSSTNEQAAAILETLADARCAELARILRSGEVPETVRRLEIPAFVIGDNRVLVSIAASVARSFGYRAIEIEEEINADVESAAATLEQILRSLEPGTIAVAGGEPTVRVSGAGRGGRCSELAVRLGLRIAEHAGEPFHALLASSDGVDGSADAAGYLLLPDRYGKARLSREAWLDAVQRSDTWGIVGHYAEPLDRRPTGNNLRDIFLLVRP